MNVKQLFGNEVMKRLRNASTLLLMIAFAVMLGLFVINLVLVNINSAQDRAFVESASDLRVLSQQLSRSASEAIAGTPEAFVRLDVARTRFDETWTLINDGRKGYIDSGIGVLTALPPRRREISLLNPELDRIWRRASENAALVLANRARIQNLNAIAASLAANIPQLQRSYEEVADTLLDSGEPMTTIAAAQRQAWLSERIALNLTRIVSGDAQAQAVVEQFQRDLNLLLSNHRALMEGNRSIGVTRVSNASARTRLAGISTLFAGIEGQGNDLITAAPDTFRANEAANAIVADATVLLDETTTLTRYFTDFSGQNLASPFLGYVLLFCILISMGGYGLTVIGQSRAAERRTAELNQRNNDAVMKLLDEISDLANGNLAVTATVSEDFTGAIADAINYAIGQLRGLVSAITDVTVQVSESTRESEKTVHYLSAASQRQSSSISSVSEAIEGMERSINHVSENARKSLGVARDSVKIASGGAEVVKGTIRGMDNIREQIQETAKRIKRLGESSQEIGGFVSLINDIADHTNTLSLNAAIQAAMAGDAGRGFGVVADEVHALAERSSDATRQIESLVRVIQRDINEAVYSMELTTTEVVQGTQLARGAGEALDDIEKVSKQLAELVEEITEAASNQAHTASEITSSMAIIQQITTETSSGTDATSEFISKLGSLTTHLQSAVSGFSLGRKGTQVKAVRGAKLPQILAEKNASVHGDSSVVGMRGSFGVASVVNA